MFTLLQRFAFGFLLFAVIIRSYEIVSKQPFAPKSEDTKPCEENPLECNNIKHYPIEHIKSLAANNKLLKETFNVEKMREPSGDIIKNNDAFDDGNDGYKTFCKSQQILAFPKIGDTGRDEVIDRRFIIQIDDELAYQQGVVYDMCLPSDRDQQCDAMKHHLDGNTTCIQKRGRKFLWALDPSTGEPKMTSFVFPTACLCMFVQNGNS